MGYRRGILGGRDGRGVILKAQVVILKAQVVRTVATNISQVLVMQQ